ncbi:hypothetical protein E8E12_000292 [Didymella heteroderae]|uniref:Uncharacterized protein n=1 Tax=Didymella heteroderae TaxID=1769908 RepID=A0A9P5C0R5_9PLEO|nr:hypothetical protein E8E12_000292 [Didymella heteroderae]
MNPINDPISDLFDFNAFDENGQDISLIADRHLFDKGPDLFHLGFLDSADQSMAVPSSGNRVDLFALTTPEENYIHPVSGREFFDNNLDLFTGENFGAGPSNFAPIDEPSSQFIAQRIGDGFGLSLDPVHSQMLALTMAPAMMFDQTQSPPRIVLTTLEEQQQWQAFKNQQPRLYQLQAQAPQPQQVAAVQQWGNVEAEIGLELQSPFQPPVNELDPLNFQDFPRLERVSQSPRQMSNPSHRTILSDQQIHLQQKAESVAHVHPSIESPPTNTAFSRDETHSEFSPHCLGTRNERRSLSFPPATSEQTPRTESAGLAFASLEDAEAAMPSRYIENAWEAPFPDQTIPTTREERAKYVLDMFEAFKDCSECKDNKNGNSFVKRWSGGPGSYYNLHAMEKVCWYILDIAERLHTEGPQSTNLYCEEALKKLKASRNMNFDQRIHHVCAMLRYSKFLCDQLMKGEGLEALVGAPKLKMSGATTMQVQNQRRQKWIVHGRTEESLHSNGNEVDEQDEDGEIRPSRRKTKPETKRPAPAKPLAKLKDRPVDISRDESNNDEESAHRRQSDPSVNRAGYGYDVDMDDEPPQVIAAVLRQPTTFPPPPSKPRHSQRGLQSTVSAGTPTPVASSLAASASSPTPSFQSSITPTPSPASANLPKSATKTKQTARFEKQKADKQRKNREAKLAATRAAAKVQAIAAETETSEKVRKTQFVNSTTKGGDANKAETTKIATKKTKTKTGIRKRPIGLTETDSGDDEPALKDKRQRTYKELLAEWMIRNDGSNDDDIREAGYAHESGRLSDTEESDSDKNADNDDDDGENMEENNGAENDANDNDRGHGDQEADTSKGTKSGPRGDAKGKSIRRRKPTPESEPEFDADAASESELEPATKPKPKHDAKG